MHRHKAPLVIRPGHSHPIQVCLPMSTANFWWKERRPGKQDRLFKELYVSMRQRRVAGQTSSNRLFDLISSECDEVKIFNQKTKCRKQGPGNNYHVFFMSLCNVQFGGGTAIENVRHKASGCTMWKCKCIAAMRCFRQDLSQRQKKCSTAGWTQITQVIPTTEESNVAEENNFWKVRLASDLWASQASYAIKHFVVETHEHDFIGAKILKMR